MALSTLDIAFAATAANQTVVGIAGKLLSGSEPIWAERNRGVIVQLYKVEFFDSLAGY